MFVLVKTGTNRFHPIDVSPLNPNHLISTFFDLISQYLTREAGARYSQSIATVHIPDIV
jgi:hypothetical protein